MAIQCVRNCTQPVIRGYARKDGNEFYSSPSRALANSCSAFVYSLRASFSTRRALTMASVPSGCGKSAYSSLAFAVAALATVYRRKASASSSRSSLVDRSTRMD